MPTTCTTPQRSARPPTFTPHDTEVALYEVNAGFARPETTVQAHLDLAERAGAVLCFGEEVREWADNGAGCR